MENGLKADRVDMLTIGDLGPSGKPLNDEVAELVRRAFHEVCQDGMKGNGTITIKLVVAPVSDGSAALHHTVTYAGPKKKRRSMMVWSDGKDIMTTDHKQLHLDNVAPIRGAGKEG